MKETFTEKKAEEHLKKKAKKISEDDIKTILTKKNKLEKLFLTQRSLKRFINDFGLFISIIRDYIKGEYRKIPYWTIAAIAAALIYVLNPADFIPDFIVGIGFIDDAFMISVCLTMVEKDLIAYKEWKNKTEIGEKI